MTCHNCEAKATKHGKTSKGLQRFKCKTCKKTFTDTSDKPLDNMYLPIEKAVLCLNMLLEGMSIRATQRITGVEKKTILKLINIAGEKCERLLEDRIKDVPVKDVQADELWAFCKMKQRTKNIKGLADHEVGSCYTFVAMETQSKLVLTYHLGKRDMENTLEFTEKLGEATTGHFQLTTDAFPAYADAVCYSLGTRVNYAQLTKIYENSKEKDKTQKKYSPTKFIKSIQTPIWGNPDMDLISTSLIERCNLSIRMHLRRFTRLTNAFSKKWINLNRMLAIFFAFYNFVRPHQTLNGATPAMAHGIEKTFWTIEDLLSY